MGCFCPSWSSRAYTDHISSPSHAPYTHTADLWWPHHTLPGGTPGSPWLQQGYSYILQIKINQYWVNKFTVIRQLYNEQKTDFIEFGDTWFNLIWSYESTVNTGYLHTWGSCRIPPYTCYSSDRRRSGDTHTVHSTVHRSLRTIRTGHSYKLKHNRDTRCTNLITQPKMLNVIHVIQSNIPETHDVQFTL